MLKISSFLLNNNSDLILLNKNLYNKIIFIEEIVANRGSFKIVDNNNFFTLLFCEKRLQNNGSSLNIRSIFFRNNLNIKINFLIKVSFFSNIYNNFLKSVHKVIFCLDKLKKSFSVNTKKYNSLIFLNTMRSGFKVIYCGIVGFFPRSGFMFLFLKIVNSKFLKDSFFVLFNLDFYSKFILRLNFSDINIKYCFSSVKKKSFITEHRRHFLHYVNIQFFFLNTK